VEGLRLPPRDVIAGLRTRVRRKTFGVIQAKALCAPPSDTNSAPVMLWSR